MAHKRASTPWQAPLRPQHTVVPIPCAGHALICSPVAPEPSFSPPESGSAGACLRNGRGMGRTGRKLPTASRPKVSLRSALANGKYPRRSSRLELERGKRARLRTFEAPGASAVRADRQWHCTCSPRCASQPPRKQRPQTESVRRWGRRKCELVRSGRPGRATVGSVSQRIHYSAGLRHWSSGGPNPY